MTAPYTDAQWARIDALGAAVDARLEAGDVRLTMGGEPTFVSLADSSTPEWSTDADGPEKRRLASVLAARLRERYASGGVVHRGQGKWYPGEPLPRWSIALQWRGDGVPLWSDPALLADPWAAGEVTPAAAQALGAEVTRLLGLPADQPARRLRGPVRRPGRGRRPAAG
ncbi:transglutaminase family protein [Nocardioides convexus]|uniref:transglutaminase family protein n=1 Tax=Nocardioides convexus TaxID=2712224 RepID=UPI00241843D0|nr:transglutaminase family protein [Nocardioides convexus]